MGNLHRGKQSVIFENPPCILSAAAVVGKKEGQGPLGNYFDMVNEDTKFGQKSWEMAEVEMQRLALGMALDKAGLEKKDIDMVYVGDLLNQCIGSSFSLRQTGMPVIGLYGACSTMALGLLMAGMSVSAGYAERAVAMTSSHFASAERQYRFPLGYGGQRTPTAQWTVTGAGAVVLRQEGSGPFLKAGTIGTIVDKGIKDANNMGAAMAPAAYETIRQHFEDLNTTPEDYDLIVTGDLGQLGKDIVINLFQRDGVAIGGRYDDCGVMIYDRKEQDVHCGGSGCGCSASVLCGFLLKQMAKRKINRLLFCGTGALLSPTSTQQGESVPSVCHAVTISNERGAVWNT